MKSTFFTFGIYNREVNQYGFSAKTRKKFVASTLCTKEVRVYIYYSSDIVKCTGKQWDFYRVKRYTYIKYPNGKITMLGIRYITEENNNRTHIVIDHVEK